MSKREISGRAAFGISAIFWPFLFCGYLVIAKKCLPNFFIQVGCVVTSSDKMATCSETSSFQLVMTTILLVSLLSAGLIGWYCYSAVDRKNH